MDDLEMQKDLQTENLIENPEESQQANETEEYNTNAELTQNADEQTPEDNKYYAAARRRAELEAKQFVEMEKQNFFKEQLGWLTNPNTGMPFENLEELNNFKEDLARQTAAAQAGLTTEQYLQLAQQIKKEVLQNDPEVKSIIQTAEELKTEKNERIFSEVLKEIKLAYPDEKASHIRELGAQFVSICASGVNPVIAYEAIRNNIRKKEQAPSMGDVSTTGSAPKDYYTKDEVKKMSDKEIDKHYDVICASMRKWE